MTRPTKRQRTDVAILHAAKVLLEEKGLDAVTFDDIAAAAGISRTTVFNHFASLSELCAALSAAEVSDVLEHCRQSGATGIPLIETLLCKLIDDTAKYPHMMTRLTNNLILSRDSSAIGEIEGLIVTALEAEPAGHAASAGDAVPAGHAASAGKTAWRARGLTAAEMAQMLMGLYYGQINHLHIGKMPFDAKAMKAEMVRMIRFLTR